MRVPPRAQGLSPDRLLPFVCLGSRCPNTCCGPFHGTRALKSALTAADLGDTIGELRTELAEVDCDEVSIFAQIRLSEKDVERLQAAGRDDLIVRRGASQTPRHYLRLLPDGTCAALAKDLLCTVHAARPTLCRAFPFYLDLFAGLSMVASCPGVGAGERTVAELSEEIEAVAEMYKLWLAEIGSEDPG